MTMFLLLQVEIPGPCMFVLSRVILTTWQWGNPSVVIIGAPVLGSRGGVILLSSRFAASS